MTPLTPKFPHLLHGGDYNPDQWLDRPDILKEDIRLMKEAHINCVSVGIFSWARLEPEEGRYDFDWLETILNNLYENGIYTVLATPSGAKPVWMSEKYPQIRRVQRNLVRDETGDRHNHCYTSPIYREKVKAIDTALARRFAKHPGVILWHLSNEYGGTCYCPLCQEAFRAWLKQKYGDLETLNHEWWSHFWSHTITDWSQIHPPLPNGEHSTHGLELDWKRFTTDQVIDFMKLERDAVKSVDPLIPVTTNFMYEFDTYNYFKFKDELDVISWDSYPWWTAGDNSDTAANVAFWHDVMRGIKRQPFLLMESTPSVTNWTPVSRLKRPGMHMAQCMQAVAHGSNSVQYFQFRKGRGSFEKFHGAVVDHYGGTDTREFQDVKAVGEQLLQMDSIYQSEVRAEVALVYDTENRWAVEGAAGPRNIGVHYLETVHAHYKALWEMGISVDVVDEECDLSGYKLVIAPMLYLLRAGFEETLKEFVRGGGTLVGTYLTGFVNENDLCYLGGFPGAGLKELFGVWNEATDGLWDGEENTLVLGEKSYRVKELCALLHTQGAKALAAYGADFYAGQPALTVNPYGAGEAYYLAAGAEADFYRDFYHGLADKLHLQKALENDPPHGVEAMLRTSDDAVYLFLQNFSGKEQTVALPRAYLSVPQGEPVTSVTLPEYGAAFLRGITK